MLHRRFAGLIAGSVVLGAYLSAVWPPAPQFQFRAVRLVDVDTPDSPLGDGTALILGASGIPTPSHGDMDAVDALYLQPHDFSGVTQAVTTPESLYPFT